VNLDIHEELPTPKSTAQDASGGTLAHLGQSNTADKADINDAKLPTPAPESEVNCKAAQILTLAEAVLDAAISWRDYGLRHLTSNLPVLRNV
jgi:hypothetical protein